MRHYASLLASLEGMSRAAFAIARELAQNSKSGLTPRFLARKLEISIEEVEYLVDVHHKFLFTDLTRIKLVPEGHHAVKRILEGLESHGDVEALTRHVRNLPDLDLEILEARLGLDSGLPKKEIAEQARIQIYRRPESVLHYVARCDFSARAREIFDSLWQSRDGILSVAQLYGMHKCSEFEVEQALAELFQGCACFELFRFDGEQRLVRAAALLKEVREFLRHDRDGALAETVRLKPVKDEPELVRSEGMVFSEVVCRLAGLVAARPVRLRNDGELFREDRRRLERIRSDEEEPSLNTCLWAAEGLGWIARVDNTLCAGDVHLLVDQDRLQRHRLLYEWLAAQSDTAPARDILEKTLEDMDPVAWYPVMDFIDYAHKISEQSDEPVLTQVGMHYEYVAPGAGNRMDSRLARVLEEGFHWLGMVERGYAGDEPCFRVTPLGRAMLTGEAAPSLRAQYPPWSGDIVVQPNYEVAADLENMDPLLTVPLDTFAVRVSERPITIYKLTREAFVHAMQQGHAPEHFIEFLLHHSRGGLPDNVSITLKDWCGTAKQVRLRTYHVLEADDPLVIAELAHQRQWRKHVAAIDPHKVLRYQGITRAQLKAALEKDGFIVNQ